MSEIKYFRIPGTNNKFVEVKIEQDEDAPNPRTEQDNVGIMVCFHNSYDLGDKDHGVSHKDFSGWDEMEAHLFKEKNAAVVLPLYLYDHSGITIATTPFSCRWDSGQVGFIYCTKEKAVEEWGKKLCTKQVKDKARKYLEGEVKEYDQYLTGDVYGHIVQAYELDNEDETLDSLEESEWVDNSTTIGEEDSCWGFFGSDWAEYEANHVAFSKMLDWMSPAAVEEELDRSCNCSPARIGTDLRGPRGCLTCYLKTLATNTLNNNPTPTEDRIPRDDHHRVAVYLVQRFSDEDDAGLLKWGIYKKVCRECWGRRTKHKNQEDVTCPLCGGTGFMPVVGQLELELQPA